MSENQMVRISDDPCLSMIFRGESRFLYSDKYGILYSLGKSNNWKFLNSFNTKSHYLSAAYKNRLNLITLNYYLYNILNFFFLFFEKEKEKRQSYPGTYSMIFPLSLNITRQIVNSRSFEK